jgi:hypothetical protein
VKISELQLNCTYDNSDLEEFTNCHPKQIISDEIIVPIWAIRYAYTTARGNKKIATKYILLNESDWDLVDPEFNSYIEEINEKHPERKLSNVEILDSTFLGKVYIQLE